jgi:predicted metal-binding membrane protein
LLTIAERTVLYSALALATAAAWSVAFMQSSDLQSSNLPTLKPFLAQVWCGGTWTAASAAATFVMWIGMMVAMMLPATAPTVDAFATIARRRRRRQEPYTPAIVFAAGYCLAWSCFSVVAVLAQWQLYRAALITPAMQNASPMLAGAALLLAGFYQFSPIKMACLRGCRSPLAFIMAEWREGYGGALLMGVRHGLICVGCCWALMSLMFCVSVMDLRWAAALGVYAAVEKLAPGGDTVIAPAFGSAAILGGASLICFNLF